MRDFENEKKTNKIKTEKNNKKENSEWLIAMYVIKYYVFHNNINITNQGALFWAF